LQQIFLVALIFLPAVGLAQNSVQGVVINGTLKRPVSNQKVELLSIAQGMKVEHETQTGSDGSFKFPPVELGHSPHLIVRAIYRGVNYNLSVASPQEMANPLTLTVFETTVERREIRDSLPVMLAQAGGNTLYVQQQYLVNNETRPRKTLLDPNGTFFFDTPPADIAQELAVSVVGLGGIPLPQTPELRSGGGYRINYPMKPGLNEVRVAFRVDYPGTQREFKQRLFSATGSTRLLVLPADLQVSGPGLKPTGKDAQTQAATYQLTDLSSRAGLDLKLVGQAPPITENTSGNADQGNGEPQVRVVRLPNRIFEKKEFIVGGFGAFFACMLLLAIRQRSRTAAPRKRDAGKS